MGPKDRRLSRRQLVQGVGLVGAALVAGCGRLPGQAREPGRLPRLGWLGGAAVPISRFEAFQEGLREYGYFPGQNITIEARWERGNDAAWRGAVAVELVRLPVDIVVVSGGLPAARAVREVTDTIPIVLTVGGDPVEAGLVAAYLC